MGKHNDEYWRRMDHDAKHFIVYVLSCQGGYYVGQTKNLSHRLDRHFKGKGARYTRTHRPTHCIIIKSYATRREAITAESELKRKYPQEHLDISNPKVSAERDAASVG